MLMALLSPHCITVVVLVVLVVLVVVLVVVVVVASTRLVIMTSRFERA